MNVGFLGAGYIADWHAKAIRTVAGARLAAICDRDEGRAEALAARHGNARTYTSLTAMLADGHLDVVHVLLPPNLHAQTAGEIIDAGLHVLLEKPMATRVEDCTELIERARSKQVKIGVGHNFLFAPIYERLRDDLKTGRLGRPDQITITWNKGLDQLHAGPFDLWMLQSAENIVLEVGSHSVAQMIDLAGLAEITAVHVANPIDLPSGKRFFRRWHVQAGHSFPGMTLNFSFAAGFSEHSIHVRGSLGSATADFEGNTYVPHLHTRFGLDYDRYRMTEAEARALSRQARRTFGQVVLSKLKPSGGNPYGESIARSLRSFYSSLAASTDTRLSPELGRDVVRTCIEIGQRAAIGVTGTMRQTDASTGHRCLGQDRSHAGCSARHPRAGRDRLHRSRAGPATGGSGSSASSIGQKSGTTACRSCGWASRRPRRQSREQHGPQAAPWREFGSSITWRSRWPNTGRSTPSTRSRPLVKSRRHASTRR